MDVSASVRKARARFLGSATAALAVAALAGAACVPAGDGLAGSTRDRAGAEDALRAFADLPLTFVENRGQSAPRVRYRAQGSHYAFSVTDAGMVLSFLEANAAGQAVETEASLVRGVSLHLRFVGGHRQPELDAIEREPGTVSYLLGDDPARWVTGVSGYRRIAYRDVWPGVDVMFHGDAGELKYEFLVRPNARPGDIRLAYTGADTLALDHDGGLRIGTPIGVLRDAAPVAYQLVGGEHVPVESRFVLRGTAGGAMSYGFDLGETYRSDRTLIIDPSLDFSTFLGGSSHDFADGIATDAQGNTYVVGTTYSNDFPTTAGAFDRTLAAAPDVSVSKLNAAGSALVYSTYLGGTPTPVPAGGADPFEFGRDIAVDAAGNAYVTGQTTSGDFPTTPRAFDRTLNVGTFDATDAFVTKLDPSGSRLVFSTFLGGTSLDDALGLAVDASGNTFVAGQTTSTNLPTTAAAFDRSANGGQDAFVTKLDAAGSNLAYSTYLGGADNELPGSIAVDAAGRAHVGGSSRSANFPTTAGALDRAANGGFDAFVTRLNAAGSAIEASTLLGGSDVDLAGGLAIDGNGNWYLAGGTISPNFPTTAGAFDRVRAGGSDAFVAKVNASASALVYSTLLGGGAGEGAVAIALDGGNRAWITGATSSANFPTTADGLDRTLSGPSDVFVTRLSAAGTRLTFSTFLGGGRAENGRDVAFSAGDVAVAGETFSAGYPTTAGAFDRSFAGDPSIFWGDGFVTRLTAG